MYSRVMGLCVAEQSDNGSVGSRTVVFSLSIGLWVA